MEELFESIKKGISSVFLGDTLMETRSVHRDSSGNVEIYLGLFGRWHKDVAWIKFTSTSTAGWWRNSLSGMAVGVSSFEEFAEFLERAYQDASSNSGDQQDLSFFARLRQKLGMPSYRLVGEYHNGEMNRTPFGKTPRIQFSLYAFTNRKGKLRILFDEGEANAVFDPEALAVLARTLREYVSRSSPDLKQVVREEN